MLNFFIFSPLERRKKPLLPLLLHKRFLSSLSSMLLTNISLLQMHKPQETHLDPPLMDQTDSIQINTLANQQLSFYMIPVPESGFLLALWFWNSPHTNHQDIGVSNVHIRKSFFSPKHTPGVYSSSTSRTAPEKQPTRAPIYTHRSVY